MIGRLRGVVLEKNPPLALIETGGISYETYMPITCFHKLPDIGKETIIFTELIIRRDTCLLFGFNDKEEKNLFRNLIKINGVGPKLALTILSGMSVQQFFNAVKQKNSSLLAKLPGISKKTADRLILEMKNHSLCLYNNNTLTSFENSIVTSPSTPITSKAEKEAISALVALGYNSKEANRMIKEIAKPNTNSEALIYKALRTTIL